MPAFHYFTKVAPGGSHVSVCGIVVTNDDTHRMKRLGALHGEVVDLGCEVIKKVCERCRKKE